jgi:heterodisulfide reductase subunit B
MANEYSFYPGCSSQKGASGSNQMISNDTMCEELDIKLNEIEDWNCCGASVGYSGGGELARLTLSARNLAISEEMHPEQDLISTCPACWLASRETHERLHDDPQMMTDANKALAEIGVTYKGVKKPARHMTEVLVEDIGFEKMAEQVKKPLEGLKIASYVGCQANRPFGIAGESFENPLYLDKMSEAMGADPVWDYEKKVSCCGGALMFSEPEKSQALVKDILEAAHDHGADMLMTPCAMCQMNVEAYQSDINATFNTKFDMPIVFYSQAMSVAFGRSEKDAALNGQLIKPEKLVEIAKK